MKKNNVGCSDSFSTNFDYHGTCFTFLKRILSLVSESVSGFRNFFLDREKNAKYCMFHHVLGYFTCTGVGTKSSRSLAIRNEMTSFKKIWKGVYMYF
jgi:hypothetical protein